VGERRRLDRTAATEAPSDTPDLTNTEIVQLRIRLIVLENVLIAVLAEGSDGTIDGGLHIPPTGFHAAPAYHSGGAPHD
jgi:hypothetical protein